jgi:proteasome accessory factor B
MDSTRNPRGRKRGSYTQAERFARMMRTLASRAVTINELADEFGITRRQVYRDLAEIEDEGHPLERSDGSGEKTWQLPLGYKGLQPITLTPYDLMSLQLARANLSHLDGTPFVEDMDTTIAKIIASLPAKTANHLERIVQAITLHPRALRYYSGKKDLLLNLRKALLLQRTVRIVYRKPGELRSSNYPVNPYTLVLYEHGLYVRGYSHRSREERLFTVDRMKQVALTEEPFEIPTSYSSTERYADQFGLIEELPQEVRILFSQDVAHLMQERQWHPSQRVRKLKNGSVEVSFHAGGLDEIAWWVLSWGKEAKVLSPPKLVKIMTDQLSKSLKHYSRA